MSGYENVVGGKLKLKGKALDVKAGGVKKKKKQKKHQDQDQVSQIIENEIPAGQDAEESAVPNEEETTHDDKSHDEGKAATYDHLTPVERKYMEQRERIDLHRMAKEANKSHRDRIQNFNQYLANMSEHYDIPKVGPG